MKLLTSHVLPHPPPTQILSNHHQHTVWVSWLVGREPSNQGIVWVSWLVGREPSNQGIVWVSWLVGREPSNQGIVWVTLDTGLYGNLFAYLNASIAEVDSCQEYCIFSFFSGEEFIFQIVADLPEETKLVLHTSWKDFLPVAQNLLARIKSYNSSLVPLEHGFNS